MHQQHIRTPKTTGEDRSREGGRGTDQSTAHFGRGTTQQGAHIIFENSSGAVTVTDIICVSLPTFGMTSCRKSNFIFRARLYFASGYLGANTTHASRWEAKRCECGASEWLTPPEEEVGDGEGRGWSV